MATITPLEIVNLVPEINPGGRRFTEAERRFQEQVQDALNNITNIVNNIVTQTVNITIGVGSIGNDCYVAGYTDPSVTTVTEAVTHGQDCIRLHSSGALVIAWHEAPNSGNVWTIRAKKSLPPYVIWTNLEGDSQEPTDIVPAFNSLGTNSILFCENKTSQALNFFIWDNTASRIKQFIYDFDGTNFTAGTGNVAVTTASNPRPYLGDVIGTGTNLLLLCYTPGTNAGVVLFADEGNPTVWAQSAEFRDCYLSGSTAAFSEFGDQKRLVDFGDGRILALMECEDVDGNANIAWALSTDNGGNWPGGDPGTPALNEFNWPGEATGFMIPQSSVGKWGTSGFLDSGNGGTIFCSWDATRIAGTNRVGLCYTSIADPTIAPQTAGVLYTEFDADTLTWTSQADTMRLSASGVYSVAPEKKLSVTAAASAQYFSLSGKAICGSDGVPRVFWLHGRDAPTSNADYVDAIAYRRLKTDGDAANTQDWYSHRDIHTFHPGTNMSLNYRVSQFCGCKEGAVLLNSELFYPVLWVRRANQQSAGVAPCDVCVKLIALSLIDLP